MLKVKFKKQNKQSKSSILFVPQTADSPKVVKISTEYSKLLIIILLTITSILLLAFLLIYTTFQNNKLTADLNNLKKMNSTQKSALTQKSNELKAIKQKEGNINNVVKDFSQKYEEITNKYIENRRSNVSRSSNLDDRNFTYDLQKLKKILDSLDNANTLDDNLNSHMESVDAKLKSQLAKIPSLWPAHGNISSPYGWRKDPQNWSDKFHRGIDISASYGSDILASADGTVIFAKNYGGYGNAIIINHGNDITTLYGHASKLLVRSGNTVKKGQIIGKIGSTGKSTGPHLHFEIHINGNCIDPTKYLK